MGQSVAHVLDVDTGDGFAAGEQQRRADTEAGVGGISVLRGLTRLVKQALGA